MFKTHIRRNAPRKPVMDTLDAAWLSKTQSTGENRWAAKSGNQSFVEVGLLHSGRYYTPC